MSLIGLAVMPRALDGNPAVDGWWRFDLDLDVVGSHIESAGVPSAVTGYAGARRRILVVDDVSDNRAMLVAALTPLGFEVGEAAGADGCIDMVRRLPPT